METKTTEAYETEAKEKYQTEHYKEESSWFSLEVSFWLFRLNPFRYVSVEQAKSQSLGRKLAHTLRVFYNDNGKLKNDGTWGRTESNPKMRPDASLSDAWDYFRQYSFIYKKPGILDYCLLFLPDLLWTLVRWLEAQTEEPNPLKKEKKTSLKSILLIPSFLISLICLLLAPILIIAMIALTLAVSPLVFLVHIFLGPEEIDKSTPLRQSFFLSPSTWMMASILLAAIGVLIQGLNPTIFGQAAVTLGIMQTVFIGMAGLTLAGGLIYSLIHLGYTKAVRDPKPLSETNPFIKYLSERWHAISSNPKTFLFIWGVGLGLLLGITGASIIYLSGIAIPPPPANAFLPHLFSLMGQVFSLSVHAMAGLPGLGFLNGISEATLSLIGEIVSAVMLSLAIFFITDNVSRMVEGVVPKKPMEEGINIPGLVCGRGEKTPFTNWQPEEEVTWHVDETAPWPWQLRVKEDYSETKTDIVLFHSTYWTGLDPAPKKGDMYKIQGTRTLQEPHYFCNSIILSSDPHIQRDLAPIFSHRGDSRLELVANPGATGYTEKIPVLENVQRAK
jgi:hypothetical protein